MYDLAHAHKIWPVPARFQSCTPARWASQGTTDYPEEWKQVRDWLAGFRRYLVNSGETNQRGYGLALVGETGVGKTMLASSILNYLQHKGFSIAFVRDGDLAKLLRVYHPDEEQEDLLAYLQRCACLVIDDLGRSGVDVLPDIEPFLRYRMDEAKPTVITANSEVPFTGTLRSLLHEFKYVNFEGVDRRVSPLEPHHGRW